MEISTLEKMTVVKLREEAKQFEKLEGVSGMTKEHLIDVLCKEFGLTRKKKIRKGIGRRALKNKIKEFKGQTAQLLTDGDRKKVRIHRRRMKTARHKLRKVIAVAAREAKRKTASAPTGEAAEETSTAG